VCLSTGSEHSLATQKSCLSGRGDGSPSSKIRSDLDREVMIGVIVQVPSCLLICRVDRSGCPRRLLCNLDVQCPLRWSRIQIHWVCRRAVDGACVRSLLWLLHSLLLLVVVGRLVDALAHSCASNSTTSAHGLDCILWHSLSLESLQLVSLNSSLVHLCLRRRLCRNHLRHSVHHHSTCSCRGVRQSLRRRVDDELCSLSLQLLDALHRSHLHWYLLSERTLWDQADVLRRCVHSPDRPVHPLPHLLHRSLRLLLLPPPARLELVLHLRIIVLVGVQHIVVLEHLHLLELVQVHLRPVVAVRPVAVPARSLCSAVVRRIRPSVHLPSSSSSRIQVDLSVRPSTYRHERRVSHPPPLLEHVFLRHGWLQSDLRCRNRPSSPVETSRDSLCSSDGRPTDQLSVIDHSLQWLLWNRRLADLAGCWSSLCRSRSTRKVGEIVVSLCHSACRLDVLRQDDGGCWPR
jgi:hypothetical protein